MAAIRRRIADLLRRGKSREQIAAEAASRLQQLRTDYRVVFGSDAGQRVLADLMERLGVSQTSFRPGQPDMTAYHEGRRRAALEIVEIITADPTAPVRMIAQGDTEELFE